MGLSSQHVLIAAGGIAAGYLCGATPFGYIVARFKGIDIRGRGSGNIGATNVGRVLGRPWGILVFALDVLKGLVPVLAFGQLIGSWVAAGELSGTAALGFGLRLLMAAACILGHMFPVFLGFKGGKGVATSLGALLGVYPYYTLPGLVAFGLWVLLTLGTRYVSVGSVGAAVAFPVIFAAFAAARRERWGTSSDLWPMYLFAIVVAALVVYRHRGNLQRLYQGTENRIGSSRSRAN